MDRKLLGDLIGDLRKQSEYGKNRFDPALANLLFKSQAEIDNDIATVIEEFVNKRGRQPTDEELAAAYVILEEKRAKKLKDKEMEEYINAKKQDLKVAEDKQRNQEELQRDEGQDIEEEKAKDEENNELFILTVNGNGDRLINREEQERSLQDRQKAIAEKTLRVLEAMEKAADAIQKGEKIPEMDLSYLKDLTPREFKQQMRVFKDFGLDPFVIGEDGQIRENPERELTIETVTLEDLENGDVAFSIPFEKMQTKEWREMAKMAKESCRRKGIESEYEPEYEAEIGDSAIEITPESNSEKIVEDDELSL